MTDDALWERSTPASSMNPAMQKAGTWLQCTLNIQHQQRQAAAGALRLAVDEPGHVVTLFRLTVDTSIPAALSLRQAAAINVKNIIGRRWSRSTHLAFRTIFSDISECPAAGTLQRVTQKTEPRCSASLRRQPSL